MKQHLGGFACASRKVAILIAMFMLASGAAWAQKKPKNKAADQSPMPKVPMPVSDEIDKDISEMLAAFQLGKVDMMHKYYSDNAVFVSGAYAPPIVGWANYVEDYKRSLAVVSGDAAYPPKYGRIRARGYCVGFLPVGVSFVLPGQALLSTRPDYADPAESGGRLADRAQSHFAGLRPGSGTTTAAITGAIATAGTESGCASARKTAAIAAAKISGTLPSPRSRPRSAAVRQTRSSGA